MRINRLIPVLILFIIDRITKSYFLSHFQLGESTSVWNDFVRLTLVHNKGAAFGTMQGKGLFLILISIVILILLIKLLFDQKSTDKVMIFGLIMIISGALGNLYDRLAYGYIIDFIDIDIPDIFESLPRWPVFNIADSCITTGITLLVIFILFKKEVEADASRSL